MKMSKEEAIELYNLSPEEIYGDPPEYEICPDCGQGYMYPAGKEMYGSDADGRRGVPLYYFQCNNCGYEDSTF